MNARSRAAGPAAARLAIAVGAPVPVDDLGPRARRALQLASDIGAPAGPALQAAARAAAQELAIQRTLEVATAQSRLVGRGLALLPIVLVPTMDVLLGLPLLAFYGTPVGRAVAAVGLAAVASGALVAGALVRRVPRRSRRAGVAPDDEVADLLGAALAAGLDGPAAARAVADVLPGAARSLDLAALALEHDRPVLGGTAVSDAMRLVAVATEFGAPAAEELRVLATAQRAAEDARVRARAERLPALLAVPSVLVLLPATVLLVGAPVVAAGLGAA